MVGNRRSRWRALQLLTATGALSALAVTFGARAARTVLEDSVRPDRGGARWSVRWPAAVFTGRFPRHAGHVGPERVWSGWLHAQYRLPDGPSR
jgi:hypothetical protein